MTDAVLFEFGPSRQQDFALRRKIVWWQRQLRTLFEMQIAWLKYRPPAPGFELPEEVREAQQEFSDALAWTLEGMADRIDGGPATGKWNFEDALARLERKLQTCCSKGSSEEVQAELQTFLNLSRRMGGLAISRDNEI